MRLTSYQALPPNGPDPADGPVNPGPVLVSRRSLRPQRRGKSRGLTAAVVTALAGLVFAANAQLAGTGSSVRHPQNLADLVRAETTRVASLSDRADQLRSEVTELTDAAVPTGPQEASNLVELEQLAVGAVPVSGPGLTVTLDDAPASSSSIAGATPDDLVIHQQDLQDVISALWAGGAEAMTLMGERVTMTSAFRCSGNVLLLHGRVFSPPYVIQAIGDPDRLQSSLDSSPGINTFLGYVAWLGLGFATNREERIEMPAFNGAFELRHAVLPPATDPFREQPGSPATVL